MERRESQERDFKICIQMPSKTVLGPIAGTEWKALSERLKGLTEKAMAPYSSTLAWNIPWREEPGRLKSMGSLRVGYD